MRMTTIKASADGAGNLHGAAAATRDAAVRALGITNVQIGSVLSHPAFKEVDPGPIKDHHGMPEDEFDEFMARRPKVRTPTGGYDIEVTWVEVPVIVIDPKEV